MAVPDYKLSSVLTGHSMDVRCVATTKEYCILSASRDRTAKLWHPEGVKDFVNVVTYNGHTNFVSCVCWLPPCERYPDGLVVTGSNDNTIIGYNLQDGAVQITLKGHDNAVCSVSPGCYPGILLSSSWDSTARVWNLNAPASAPLVLKGHQAAVWSVHELGNGNYATASADKTIKLWKKDGELITTLTGHTDCVRDLAVANKDSFLSCSNDASIRLWSNNGQCLNTYYGHSNYIYSISMNPGVADSFATCGEDGSVRIWAGGDCVRDIRLPVHSVWSVVCLDNGDIVTGSSDGLVRVFTKDPARYADDSTLKVFDEEVEKMVSANQQEIGGFKLSELPGPEVLLEPGKNDGQIRMVRRGTTVKCYSWSVAENTWNEVGDVMGAKGASEGKTMHQGEEYDFVFSVDIQENAPPLKLPFNRTEDPWVAAQAFIHKNNLPQVYLEQVANFIITNAKLDSLPTPSSNGFADPFTGESRYVPGSGSVPGLPPPSAADPFTGEGAYTTAAAKAASTDTNTLEKPLLPHDAYLRFDQANLKAIYDKLKEFNSKVGDGFRAMTDQELQNVVKLGEMNSAYDAETIHSLKKMLEWPSEIIFPVLDITRLAVRNKEINAQIFDTTNGPTFVQFLMSLLTPDNLPANQMLAMRVLVNAFSDLPGEMLVIAAREGIVHAIICLTQLNNNAQIAAASLLLNLSVALAQQDEAVELADCIIQLISRITDNEAYFSFADPFTGESRYVPGSGSVPGLPPPSAADPFTGEGAYTTAAAKAASTDTNTLEKPLLPHDAYLRFDQANLKAIYDKLKEFNSKVGDGFRAMTDQELQNVVKLGEMNSAYDAETIHSLKKMLEWPSEIIFPVLDITRLAVRNKEINAQIFDTTNGPTFVQFLMSLLTPDNLPANQMLAMRVLVNAFSDLPGEMLVIAAREGIVHAIICLTQLNNNAQIAAASLLLNLSVALAQQDEAVELADCIIQLISRITDNEAYFRALIALGTILAETSNKLEIQSKIITSSQLHSKLKRDSTSSIYDANFKKISICSRQILSLL